MLSPAAAMAALAGCGMSYEECRAEALKEWQKCAGEAIRNEYPRPGALGDCARTHERKKKGCERRPKEAERSAAPPPSPAILANAGPGVSDSE